MIGQNPKRKIFEKLYEEYVDKIYRFISLKVSSQEISQDLCSETFLRFWESLNTETKINNPKAFIYQIARNLTIDYYRQKNQVQLVSAENISIDDPSINLEKEAEVYSEIDQVQKALNCLKEEYQDVIIWRYLDELSIGEIAEILNSSENAVRIMIHRALKALRELMENFSVQGTK